MIESDTTPLGDLHPGCRSSERRQRLFTALCGRGADYLGQQCLEIKSEIRHEERQRADTEIAAMSNKLSESRRQAEEEASSRRQLEANIDAAARVTANVAMIIIFILGVPLIVLLAAFTQSESLHEIHPALPSIARVTAIILTVLSLTIPFNLMSAGKRIKTKIENGIRRTLLGAAKAPSS